MTRLALLLLVAFPVEAQILHQYCVRCHNPTTHAGNLNLADTTDATLHQTPEIAKRVLDKVRGGFMPPPDLPGQSQPRPDKATTTQFLATVEESLDHAALTNPNPGRVPLHRLNRAEYGNAVRDLLNLKIDPESLLPPDDANNGFDNQADALATSPSLIERYVSAARKISALALGDPEAKPAVQTFLIRGDLSQDVHAPGLPLGTRGGLRIENNFPLDAEYDFRATLIRSNRGIIRGIETPTQLEIAIDGARVKLIPFGGKADEALSNENPPQFATDLEHRFHLRIPVKAGPHVVTVAFLQESLTAKPDMTQPRIRDKDNTQAVIGVPELAGVSIGGPANPTGVGDTPSRRQILAATLTTLARRAYRRPPTPEEINQLATLQKTFGLRRAIAQILANPQFLFRFEPDPATLPSGTPYNHGDLELASRLSFFLWSSIPDDELLNLAIAKKLSQPATLSAQVKRMLADPKSAALVENFAGQWLYLRNLKRALPDQTVFPDFDDNLRQAFLRETELFTSSIFSGDRSVLLFLNADYTFLNERLARHYGVRGVYGDQFRRVTLSDANRRGLLGQGSILTVTSYANRTSAVLRGKWILTNLLGTPPPPPPPNVPALNESAPGDNLPLRARMEQHRANPACAACHKAMDPLGLALENFDATGHFRPGVDATAEFPDGTAVNGVAGLRDHLLENPTQFSRALTERLMTYALGRPTESFDQPLVRSIVRDAAKNDYKFSNIVLGIVNSPAFRMKVKP